MRTEAPGTVQGLHEHGASIREGVHAQEQTKRKKIWTYDANYLAHIALAIALLRCAETSLLVHEQLTIRSNRECRIATCNWYPKYF
jgi:hypothetical protein